MFPRIRIFLYPFIVILIALWSVWPVLTKLTTSLPIGHEDIFITWILNQHIQKIPYDIGNLFNGNIFYPYKNTLTYSEIFLTSALVSFIPVKITGSFLSAFNVTLISGQVFTLVVLYLFLKEVTEDRLSSLLGTVAFSFSQIRMHYFVHIQLWVLEWFLLSIWMIWKFSKKKRPIYLYLAAFFSIIQLWESILPFFWIIVIAAVILLPQFNLLKKNIKHMFLIFIIFSITTLPLLSTYYDVSKEFNFQRSIRDAAHFSMGLDRLTGDFFSPGLFTLGIGTLLLVHKKKLFYDKNFKWLVIVMLFGLIMALGPVLKWEDKTVKLFDNIFIPLPYGLTYYIVPGFGALRTPSRWIILFALGLSGIIAITLSKLKSKHKTAIFLVALAIAIFGGTRIKGVVQMPTRNEYPKVYSWLKYQEGNVVLELPIYTAGVGNEYIKEMYRMLYSLEHKKNLVNGYSGFYPPQWEMLVNDLNHSFPKQSLVDELSRIGVDYIIVHTNELEESKLDEVDSWGSKKIVWEDDKTRVYKL